MKYRLDRSIGGLLINQFFEFWLYYVFALACLYMTHWTQSHLPFMAKEMADSITGDSTLKVSTFLWLAVGIIVFRTLSRLLFFYPARIMQKNLRVEFMERLEKALPNRYKKYSAGQVFQTVISDMDEMRALVGFALLQVGNIAIALFVLVPKLSNFHPKLILALIPLFLAFFIFVIVVSQNRKYYKLIQDSRGDVQNVIVESYNGKRTIKNFQSENVLLNLFDSYSMKELRAFYKAGLGIAFSMPLLTFGIGLSLLWGSHICYEQQLGASSLVLFSGFIFLFLEPIMFLSWIGVVFARSLMSWKRIKNLINDLSSKSDFEESIDKDSFKSLGNTIEFNLNFWDNKISFEVKKNSILALVGQTGCGKTYVLSQVLNLLKLNGRSTSYVSQDPYLFNDNIRNNLFLGREVDPEGEKEALKLIKLFGLNDLSPNQNILDLEVGENGKRLSGGQVKRLCLVRSLMSESEFVVWDDPFSSVDIIFENEIFTELKKEKRFEDKTVLITSHRLTTTKYVDEILLICKDEQSILEQGEREKLLTNKETKVYEYFKNQMV